MSEAAAPSAPAAAPSATQGTNAPVLNTEQAWTPPATREAYLEQARRDVLSEPETRIIAGKNVTRPRSEWLQESQRLAGLNAKHQQTVEAEKKARAEAERYRSALKSGDTLFERLLEEEGGVKALEDAYLKAKNLASMTPEQRMQWQKQRDLEDKAAQLEELKKTEAQKAEERKQHAMAERHLDGLEDAFEKLGWMPDENVEPIADLVATGIIEHAQENKIPMSYSEVARLTQQTLRDVGSSFVQTMDDEQLAEFIGKERLQKIIGAQVSQLQSGRPSVVPPRQDPNRAPNGQFAPANGGGRPQIRTYSPGTGEWQKIVRGQ